MNENAANQMLISSEYSVGIYGGPPILIAFLSCVSIFTNVETLCNSINTLRILCI
jgi:hypothetical protein